MAGMDFLCRLTLTLSQDNNSLSSGLRIYLKRSWMETQLSPVCYSVVVISIRSSSRTLPQSQLVTMLQLLSLLFLVQKVEIFIMSQRKWIGCDRDEATAVGKATAVNHQVRSKRPARRFKQDAGYCCSGLERVRCSCRSRETTQNCNVWTGA